MHTHGFVSRQTKTRAKAEGEKYSAVSADSRHGSSGGEVDWWLVRCHGESGEVLDVSNWNVFVFHGESLPCRIESSPLLHCEAIPKYSSVYSFIQQLGCHNPLHTR